jgi:SAM-dependent methyltransferase
MPSTTLKHGSCPVCGWDQLAYTFATSGGAFFECYGCGIFLCDQTRSQAEEKAGNFWSEDERAVSRSLNDEEKGRYLDLALRQASGKKLLEIGCGDGSFLAQAAVRGFEVSGFEGDASLAMKANTRLGPGSVSCSERIDGVYPPGSFDVIVLFDLLGLFENPFAMMQTLRGLLRKDGLFLFSIPVVDSRPAVLLRQNWVEFNKRQSMLFDKNNIQNALFLTGFDRTLVLRHPRLVSIDWLRNYLEQFQLPWSIHALTKLAGTLPGFLRRKAMKMEGGHVVVMTHARAGVDENILSIVIPVYNERKTFRDLMEGVLAKEIPGLKKEIILVESNSTDGSRDDVLSFKDRPGVQIILEEKAMGKGHAVRMGLARATGDYILIQDADLEYDLEDYDALLEPLVKGREAFVLGSRHGGKNVWKMRKFSGQSGLSLFVNFGHWVFTWLINLLFLQRLQDPFTMYKVFRRDCLYGLEFECNRFDFDYELLIKLILKGYEPVELPVNYQARSFKEGKKVRLFRDPLNWLKALAWLRLLKIDPLKVVNRANPGK